MSPDLQILMLIDNYAQRSNNDLEAAAGVLRLAADQGAQVDCEHAIYVADLIVAAVRNRLNEVESKLAPLIRALKDRQLDSDL